MKPHFAARLYMARRKPWTRFAMYGPDSSPILCIRSATSDRFTSSRLREPKAGFRYLSSWRLYS